VLFCPCSYYSLKPDIKVIAPWREWDLLSRTKLIEWAEARNIAVPSSKRGEPPFSMDANLLHISYEGEPAALAACGAACCGWCCVMWLVLLRLVLPWLVLPWLTVELTQLRAGQTRAEQGRAGQSRAEQGMCLTAPCCGGCPPHGAIAHIATLGTHCKVPK
jgi:hypothetical protein